MGLGGIPGLLRVERLPSGGLGLGALVTLSALAREPQIRSLYPMLSEAAAAAASPQIRAMGTLGGNLLLNTRCCYYNQSGAWRSSLPVCLKAGGDTCNAIGGGRKCFAIFSGDLAPSLLTLGAQVQVTSPRGERALAVAELYTGDGVRPLALEPDELLTGVELPAPSEGAYSRYFKYRTRGSLEFPFASVAALIDVDRSTCLCREARIAIGAISSKPFLLDGLSDLLRGKSLVEPLIEEAADLAWRQSKPVENIAGVSARQRRRMVRVFVRRALSEASGRARTQEEA
jgi:4-hydroxybenzoyl-CoA reductase subunit beta